MSKKVKKWLLLIAGGLLSLVLAAALVTQTAAFRDWLRDKIEDIAANHLQPDLKIGKIGGNLITNFELEEVLISEKFDTLLYLPRLQFRILPEKLLQNELQLQVLAIDSLQLFLQQNVDSSWQFQHILAEDTTATPATEGSGFTWKINLQHIRINDASVRVDPIAEIRGMPRLISNCDLTLAALVEKDTVKIGLRNLEFKSSNPQITLQKFACKVRYFGDEIYIDAIELRSLFCELTGSMHYNLHSPAVLSFQFFAKKFALQELSPFVEQQIIYGTPAVNLTGNLSGDSLQVKMNIREHDQFIGLNLIIADIAKLNRYTSSLRLENFAPGKWLANDSLDLTFDGEVNVSGSGVDVDTMAVRSKVRLNSIKFAGRRADSLRADAEFDKGDLTGKLDFYGPQGQFSLTGQLHDVAEEQRFIANLNATNIDLNHVLLLDSLQSNFNFEVAVAGQYLNPDFSKGKFDFAMRPSSVAGVHIDTLFSWGNWDGGSGEIDTLHIESPLGRFFLAGKMGLETKNDIRFRGDLGNLQWMQTRLAADTLNAAGYFAGSVFGKANSLALQANYLLHNLTYNEIAAEAITGKLTGNLAANAVTAAGAVALQDFNYAGTAMDSAAIRWHFADSTLTAKLDFARRDSIDGELALDYVFGETPTVKLNSFATQIKNLSWRLAGAPATLKIGADHFEINNAIFHSGAQKIVMAGQVNENRANDLRINVQALEVQPIASFMQIEEELSGLVSAKVHLAGTAQHPSFTGDVAVENGRIMEFDFEKFAGQFSLVENKLNWDFTLNQDSLRGMQFDGFLPLNRAAEKDGSIIQEDAPLRLHAINTRRGGLDLAFLQAFFPDMKNVEGRFLANVLVTNTWANPLPAGTVRVFDGKFNIPRYGVRYNNVQIATVLDSTEIQIQQFDLNGGDGLLGVSGKLSFSEGLQAGLQAAELNLSAKEFQIAKNRDIFMVIDADARLFGDVVSPAFDGEVKLRRSTLNLNALENSRYVELEQMQPLLEQARLDTSAGPIISKSNIAADDETAVDEVSRFYQNLKGELRIEIGRNTWLRSPALNVEVHGQLLQAKQGPEFEMPVGVVSVVRGSYDFLGKTFKIENGEFTLDGGDEINPLIELEAVYAIRDADHNKIRILVSGRVLDPQIKFYFNNEEIEESNAVSYIVFGRNLEQVSSGERQDLQSGQLLTQLAAAQLGKTLGKKLSLDVIEFQGKSGGDEASSITVGRYISNHIFISIQQLLGGDNWETMEGLRATLELELRKNIFMQFTKGDEKSTGFDLVWKYQK